VLLALVRHYCVTPAAGLAVPKLIIRCHEPVLAQDCYHFAYRWLHLYHASYNRTVLMLLLYALLQDDAARLLSRSRLTSVTTTNLGVLT
jgi:hypothetical protein